MKLTIHIGSHKAGSTAIQNTCSRETALLEQAGVYYPENLFPKYPKQHSELAALAEHGEAAELQAAIDRVFSDAADRGLSHAFLSGEDLCNATSAGGVKRLAEAVTGVFDAVSIVLVVSRGVWKFPMSTSGRGSYDAAQAASSRTAGSIG